jgi:hypothetical protein
MADEQKPDLSNFFARPANQDLQRLIQTLEQQPGFKELEQSIPAEIKASLEAATPEFLAGYLLGQDHAIMAVYSSSDAAAKGDARTAQVIRQRRDLITLLVARRLTGATSNLILLTEADPRRKEI